MNSLQKQKPLWSSGYDTHRHFNTTNYRGLFGRLQFKSGHGHVNGVHTTDVESTPFIFVVQDSSGNNVRQNSSVRADI